MVSTARAHKIGSLLFCPHCSTLLDLPQTSSDAVTCEQCGHLEPSSSYDHIKIVTRSHPDAFPSALRQKRKTQTETSGDALLRVKEKCPACSHGEALAKELQLRSADEGSTILYTCAECKHRWTVNN